jgi:ribosome-associated heat shock protein Hsp15
MAAAPTELRLDKWLWAARFYKTRQVAVEAIERHRVRVNGQACKPARVVRVGDRIALQQDGWWREVELVALSMQRGPAPVAQQLYQDTADSVAAAAAAAERRRLMPEPADGFEQGRPTKRERRDLDRWTTSEADREPPEWERWSARWDGVR